ncbi:SRPBCC family protein [Mycobacterium crocinum]|uniref:SRPBCC family protein n=1 Tax=Mycolicibacterium crocinum TaxID=388459 RepID=A0ABY3TLX9_9MYCO|nr:SRPBCC family protein [Mycolicibacterium crocinum]MCV7216589.1 SRPBCC family protein [Mycolicibacterium crocinum]ULN41950.1 SRPBCC family protein [Mycolicibacterium crocinum]
MISSSSISIDAPADLVWEVFTDVEHWPDWTASVTTLRGLDGAQLAVGRRFEIKQPRMPKLVWTVTELEPGTSWTWVQRSPGGVTSARHDVAPAAGGTTVRQELSQGGVIGSLVGVLMRQMTQRYLTMEAHGLKAHSESLRKLRGSNA